MGRALPPLLSTVRTLEADQGATVKNVHRLFDGATVESVLMRYPHRVTMCISSQAGCGMNCPFCATGQAGLTRNLSAAEMVEQVVHGARMLRGGRVGRADEHRLVGQTHVLPVAVGLGEHRHRADLHLAAGADDPAGDLAPVGDQDLADGSGGHGQ